MSESILREFVEALAKIRLDKWCNQNGVERGDLSSGNDADVIRLTRRAARKALELAGEEQCPRAGTCRYFMGDHCNHENVMMSTGTLKKKAEEEQAAEEEMKTVPYMTGVMQEADEGADVEFAHWGKEDWIKCGPAPVWNWGCVKYRVKPRKPLEGWVNVYPTHRNPELYATPETADHWANSDRTRRVHMREVVE